MHRYLLILTVVAGTLLLGGRWRSGTVWFPPGGCTEANDDPLIVEQYVNGAWVSLAGVREGDCVSGPIHRLIGLRACCDVDPTKCSTITQRGVGGTCNTRYELP